MGRCQRWQDLGRRRKLRSKSRGRNARSRKKVDVRYEYRYHITDFSTMDMGTEKIWKTREDWENLNITPPPDKLVSTEEEKQRAVFAAQAGRK